MRAAFLWEPKGQICDDNCYLMAAEREREREGKRISLRVDEQTFDYKKYFKKSGARLPFCMEFCWSAELIFA